MLSPCGDGRGHHFKDIYLQPDDMLFSWETDHAVSVGETCRFVGETSA